MLRLSKITDYGIVILADLAQQEAELGLGEAAAERHESFTAREIAEHVELPVPVVSKVLKSLTRAGILDSQRGSKGGYALASRPEDINVAEMITALDGPLALTQCTAGPSLCDLETRCAIRTPWQVINEVVHNALASITLADLINPDFIAHQGPGSLLGVLAGPHSGVEEVL
jgi:FeS assembly SUF system regulator